LVPQTGGENWVTLREAAGRSGSTYDRLWHLVAAGLFTRGSRPSDGGRPLIVIPVAEFEAFRSGGAAAVVALQQRKAKRKTRGKKS
jgi:hypothetical protein